MTIDSVVKQRELNGLAFDAIQLRWNNWSWICDHYDLVSKDCPGIQVEKIHKNHYDRQNIVELKTFNDHNVFIVGRHLSDAFIGDLCGEHESYLMSIWVTEDNGKRILARHGDWICRFVGAEPQKGYFVLSDNLFKVLSNNQAEKDNISNSEQPDSQEA